MSCEVTGRLNALNSARTPGLPCSRAAVAYNVTRHLCWGSGEREVDFANWLGFRWLKAYYYIMHAIILCTLLCASVGI